MTPIGLTRAEFLDYVDPREVAVPLIHVAYDETESEIMRQDLEGSPHGTPWHTSFHASEFPGDKVQACGRYQMYSLMNVPTPDDISRDSRALMDVGKDVEIQIVRRLYDRGLLVSGDPSGYQMGYKDKRYWLTGSSDATALEPGTTTPRVLEFKGKDHDKVVAMIRGDMTADDYHRAQLLTYIGMANHAHAELWPDGVTICNTTGRVMLGPDYCAVHGKSACLTAIVKLEPVQFGSLVYFSRQRPMTMHEFRFELDDEFMEAGYKKLQEWQRHFREGTLPGAGTEGRHPMGWKWSEDPCDWCAYKKFICKPDHQAGVTRLEDSHAIAYSKGVSDKYDPLRARELTLERWGETPAEEGSTDG